jgi:hypothetical protein
LETVLHGCFGVRLERAPSRVCNPRKIIVLVLNQPTMRQHRND